MKNTKDKAIGFIAGLALATVGSQIADYNKPIIYDESNPNHLIARAIEANIGQCEVLGCSEADIERMRLEWKSYYDKI